MDFDFKTYWEEMESGKRFHEHLDACERCRHSPFDLCALGSMLLSWVRPVTDLAKDDPKT